MKDWRMLHHRGTNKGKNEPCFSLKHTLFSSFFYAALFAGCISTLASSPLQAQAPLAQKPVEISHNSDPMMRFYLELIINGKSSGHIAAVDYQDQQYSIALEDLLATAVLRSCWDSAPLQEGRKVVLNRLHEVDVVYEQALQRLMITVPTTCLPAQTLDASEDRKQYPPQNSFGMMLNYDLYTYKVRHDGGISSLWSELRGFGDYGIFSHTGVYRHAFEGADDESDGYRRYDTNWKYFDEEKILSFEAGDIITRPVGWSSAIRLGGIQLSRDFSLRPDVITYPLPQFAGQVSVPSSLELFIDGARQYEGGVDPGPFSLSSAPILNGAGEAVIMTTDTLGRQVLTTIPFYVTPSLLKSGLSDYTFSLGTIRKNYGQKDFDYGPFAADASYRYGVTDYITLEAHAEGSSSLFLGGTGAIVQLGNLGVLNTSYAHSRYSKLPRNEHGVQSTVSYQYTARSFGLGAKYIYRDQDFRDLSVLDVNQRLSRETAQITGSMTLGQWGNISAGYFTVDGYNTDRTEVINLSWKRSFKTWGTVLASANHFNQDNDWSFSLQWIIPLGSDRSFHRGTMATSIERNANREMTYRVNYQQSAPTEGGIGWSAGYEYSPKRDDYRQAKLEWRNPATQLQAGIYGTSDRETVWADASGSFIWMDQSVFVANQVHDAFVVVSTDGIENIPVKYENNLVGRTNKRGHVLVPWTSSYYAGKYEIDPLNLPLNLKTPLIEQRVAVKRGGGYLLRFPVEKIVATNVILVDEQRAYIPAGAQIVFNDGKQVYVGWDGMAYMENLHPDEVVQVYLPQGGQCTARLAFDGKDWQEHTMMTIGPVICYQETKQ